MKVYSQNQSIVFQRKLKGKKEIAQYQNVVKKAKEIVGQTGDSILVVHDSCLPQSKEFDIGVSHLGATKSLEFFDAMKTYLGINSVEILPQGPISPHRGVYCAYSSSALPLANYVINPELLLDGEFSSLITREELDEVVKANESKNLIADYKNVVGDESNYNNLLKKAFQRFKDRNGLQNQKYKAFVKENADWIEPLIKAKNEAERDFYRFKQFLAEEHLKIARKELNKRGIKLTGDCQVGFSPDEINAFKDAFDENKSVGWGLRALNYDTILDPNSASYQLLKRKVQLAARRYDNIRFDVSWAYVTPKLYNQDGTVQKREMGDSILKLIDSWVKEVKGEDFDTSSLLHEYEVDPRDFQAFDEKGRFIQPLQGRKKVYSTMYMDYNWGSNDAYANKRNWSPREFVVGVGNHDTQLLREMAEGVPLDGTGAILKEKQIGPLSAILNIPVETLENPVEFAKAKFAEPMMARNNMVFYLDVFGRKDHFTVDDYKNPGAYARRIPVDFEDAYIKSLQEGFGFNIMDSFEKIFVAKGYDKEYPEIFNEIIKYKNILLEQEPIKNNKDKSIMPIVAVGTAVVSLSAVLLMKIIKSKNKTVKTTDTFEKTSRQAQLDYTYRNFNR